MKNRLQSWLREPLVHFVALGVALFGVYALLNRSSATEDDRRIEISTAQIEWLAKNWEARWRRPPTEAELRGLVAERVRQEALYRQALALGFDQDDEVIRRRMVQKLEFLTEDLVARAPPTEAELTAYYQEHLDRYRLPELRSFTHVYLNVDQRGESAMDDANQLLADLRTSSEPITRAPERGDRFMLPFAFTSQSQAEVDRTFGQRFAAALFDVEPGDWQGPVASGYGVHLVRVTEVQESHARLLEDVRPVVLRDFEADRKKEAHDALVSALLAGYEVVIDEDAILERVLREDSMGGGR